MKGMHDRTRNKWKHRLHVPDYKATLVIYAYITGTVIYAFWDTNMLSVTKACVCIKYAVMTIIL